MRRLLSLLATFTTIALLSGGAVAAAGSGTEVRTKGDERVVINSMVQATLRFTPGKTKVASGDSVTWTHDDFTPEPHTITIVANPPGAELDEIFACAECAAALAAHSAGGFTPVVNAGAAGLDVPGDSLFLFDDQSVTAPVTAPAGTTLTYLCAIHPWMQGTIQVQ